MKAMRLISLALSALLAASPVLAAVESCDRMIPLSNGGVAAHQDLQDGKVMWVEWWAQEGNFHDVWLAECRTGTALSLRTWEDRIKSRYVAKKTERVIDKILRQSQAASAFFTIDRVADVVRKDGVDLTVAMYPHEFCACAVAYPELRGEKAPFKEDQG